MISWTPITRGLPKDGEEVLAWVAPGDVWPEAMFVTWHMRGSVWMKDKAGVQGVTHWARINAPEGA